MTYFSQLTNIYFSTYQSLSEKIVKMLYTVDTNVFELNFWEEIYGCVKYIGIPYDTVMAMPVQDRKTWIQKHNIEAKKKDTPPDVKERGSGNISGEMLNGFAKREQQNEGG